MKLHIREIDHVVLRVRDMERMVRFYAEILGAEVAAFRPKFNMTYLRAGSAMIDLVAGDPGAGRNVDHFWFAHRTVRRYGAEGNGVSIYLTDPRGTRSS